MEGHPMFMDWQNQYCEKGYTAQSKLQIHAILIKIPMSFFIDTGKLNIHLEA
jgi:hypothetical protein